VCVSTATRGRVGVSPRSTFRPSVREERGCGRGLTATRGHGWAHGPAGPGAVPRGIPACVVDSNIRLGAVVVRPGAVVTRPGAVVVRLGAVVVRPGAVGVKVTEAEHLVQGHVGLELDYPARIFAIRAVLRTRRRPPRPQTPPFSPSMRTYLNFPQKPVSPFPFPPAPLTWVASVEVELPARQRT